MSLIFKYTTNTELASILSIQLKFLKNLSNFYFKISNDNSLEIFYESELSNLISIDDTKLVSKSEITKTNTISSQNYENLTVDSIFFKFIQSRKLSTNTAKLYKTAISQVLGSNFNAQLNNIDLVKIYNTYIHNTNAIKPSTIKIYSKCYEIWLNWLIKQGVISEKSIDIQNYSNNEIMAEHRPALNCEYFCSEQDAKSKIKTFLKSVKKHVSEQYYKLWLIHSILGTRRSETISAISNYNPKKECAVINTKCRKNFSIPITREIKSMVLDIQPWIKSLSPKTAEQYLYRCIPNKYKKDMCPHGSRALFRTVIDLIESCNASFEVKEAYLCHFAGSSCQKAYLRADYFYQRAKLQSFWAQWLIKLQ